MNKLVDLLKTKYIYDSIVPSIEGAMSGNTEIDLADARLSVAAANEVAAVSNRLGIKLFDSRSKERNEIMMQHNEAVQNYKDYIGIGNLIPTIKEDQDLKEWLNSFDPNLVYVVPGPTELDMLLTALLLIAKPEIKVKTDSMTTALMKTVNQYILKSGVDKMMQRVREECNGEAWITVNRVTYKTKFKDDIKLSGKLPVSVENALTSLHLVPAVFGSPDFKKIVVGDRRQFWNAVAKAMYNKVLELTTVVDNSISVLDLLGEGVN